MSSLMSPFPEWLSVTSYFISWVAYVFEEPVNWPFILSRYSVTVSHSRIEPTIAGSIVFFHSHTFLVDIDPFSMLKVIGRLLGCKIPLSGCPSGISLVCLPHRRHRLCGTWCGDCPVHLSQDEGQVDLFLPLCLVVTFESGDLFDTTHQVVPAWKHNLYRVRT